MMRIGVAGALCAIILGACTGGSGEQVASLADGPVTPAPGETDAVEQPSSEDAILAFSACMRDNGLENFEDPEISADDGIRFGFRQQVADGIVDRETVRQAMETCRVHLDGVAVGRDDADRSEIEDQLVEFAACMRDEGFDLPDPDFSSQGDGRPGDPFAGNIDSDDPDFQNAMEACEDLFEGGVPIGPGPRGSGG
jgi:hypothetical protein